MRSASDPTATTPPDTAFEPVAVVGLACRFPGGADSPEALWRLLTEGRDAIVDVPPSRWDADAWFDPDPNAPGKMRMRQAGFLREDIAAFDAPFFAIAPREAMAMDPQQRLLLEVAWEALERAGTPPDRLAGAAVGVFLGLYHANYGLSLRGSPAPAAIDGWSASGSHVSVAAGRLSYFLDLAGPSLVVDTACSSSLVAVHLAVQSLQARECDQALAGGVHLLLAPEPLVASSKLGATSPDGRCKAFDASADGFGHGEGCGIVVLKRLSDALAAGDTLHAVIRGSCVNQDGRSNSLTAPSGPAQENAVRTALARAGIAPRLVGYVEAHGTGTPLGDPIEIEALANALGEARDTPLRVGSLKTNLGHLEAAAGIAGLIKAILCVEHGTVPASLHFSRLNPHIDVGDVPIEVPTRTTDWVGVDGRRIAGVSAFGFSGTNAHVVIEAPPVAQAREPAPPRALALPLSARTGAALTHLAHRWADWLERGEASLADAAFTASRRRAFRHRLAVVGADAAAVARALRTGKPDDAPRAPKVAFLFTGQGAQHAGMARQAYAAWPVFRAALDQYLEVLTPLLGEPARERLFGSASLDETRLAQPLTVAVELALAQLWRSWGIEPSAVAGHSVGEFAAAAVAGVLSPRDALTLVASRGRLMQSLPAGGGMLAIGAAADRVSPLVDTIGSGLALAAINGPSSTVVSGPLPALQRLEATLREQGLRHAPLAVSHAFHSSLLEPILPAFEREAAAFTHRPPTVPIVSNVTGQSHTAFDAAYWRRHAREPVRFHDGLQALAALGCDVALELGPHAVLTPLGAAAAPSMRFIPTLQRGLADDVALAQAQAALFRAGASLQWDAIQPGRVVAAPTYPFERERHWFDPAPGRHASVPAATLAAPSGTDVGSPLVFDFYDELTVISGDADASADRDDDEGNLSFGFLPEPVPGFSWVQGLFERGRDAPSRALFLDSQQALKDALFEGIDFARMQRVLDYGCGHAADVCRLASRHPNLALTGYTLSARQVAVGTERARRLGVAERVRLHRRDSSADAFPGPFDCIFGIEVTGLIADKEALFDNVAAHLAPGGLLAIADFVAAGEAIANPATNSFTPSLEQWAELLATRHLRLTRVVDGSREVANWLVDDRFEETVAALVQRFGFSELTHRHLLSNGNIGKGLRLGLMRYLLMVATPSPYESVAALREANAAALRDAPSPRAGASEAWRTWAHAPGWQPSPPAPAPVDTAQLARALQPVLAEERARLAPLAGAHAAFDTLAHAFTAEALAALKGAPATAAQERLARHLATRQAATPKADRRESAQAMLDAARRTHPEADAEWALLARCGPMLAEALAGRADPLELLFPGGDASLAEALYERSPWSRSVQRLAAAAIAALPREAPLRVIEIGGGTGATTAHVLDALPAGSRYVFTDLGPSLVARAQARFGERIADYAPLDVTRSPATQGFAPGAWDAVVAANVLHATPSLAEAIANARELLAPGGLLLLIENTSPLPWGDLTFGLTPGMWQFRDADLRQHALASTPTWRTVLAKAGFDGIDVLAPDVEGEGGVSRQALIVARHAPRRRWWVAGSAAPLAQALSNALPVGGDECRLATDSGAAIPADVTDVALVLDAPADARDPAPLLREALGYVQSALGRADPPAVTLITRGAAAVDARGEAASPACLAAAALPGFARAVAAEAPDLRLRWVDADPTRDGPAQAATMARLLTRRGPTEMALRAEARFEPRLRAVSPDARAPIRFATDASYLLTGAFGGIGLALLPWLAERGARHLVLAGRRAPGADALAAIESLRAQGVTVATVLCDVSTIADVEAAVAKARALAPLKGVFHSAGVVADAAIAHLDAERIDRVLAAKASGTLHLHEATRQDALDHFVLFSSSAALLGPSGQANHAAACAFQSAVAHWRRAQGLPAVAIDWGAWAEVGAAAPTAIERHVSRTGLRPMPPAEALRALDWALAASPAEIALVDADWPRYRSRYRRGGEPSMLEGLGVVRHASSTPRGTTTAPTPSADWRGTLAALAPGRRADRLRDLIRAEAARILGLADAAALDDRAPLREAGLDSLMAVEMRNALATAVGQRLPATLLFDHPAVADLAQALAREAFAELFAAPAPPAGDASLAQLDAQALSALLADELRGTEGR